MGGASGICDLAFFCHVPVGIDLREALPLFWKVFDGKIADTGQTGMQAPQSMHSSD